jgi:predicted nucleotidyltransferase
MAAWKEAPAELREQVRALQAGLADVLGDSIVGIYVHGSLALDCFNPARSDADLIAVVSRPLALDEKLELSDLLLRVSAAPFGIELHVLTTDQLDRWQHPAPFELHYGESHREALAFEPVTALERMGPTDADLAAHLKVARTAGFALAGPSPHDVFPDIPWEDYADSLRRDLEWTRRSRSALYGVLSPCRVWASLETGEVHSKASGARWALTRLPEDLRPQVERALGSYTGTGEPIELDDSERGRLQAYIEDRVRAVRVS